MPVTGNFTASPALASVVGGAGRLWPPNQNLQASSNANNPNLDTHIVRRRAFVHLTFKRCRECSVVPRHRVPVLALTHLTDGYCRRRAIPMWAGGIGESRAERTSRIRKQRCHCS